MQFSLKQSTVLLLVVLMLVSCSKKRNLIPSEVIVGKWEMINLEDLNARLKIHYEELAAPFEPITSVRVTFNIDGTGYSVTNHEHKAKYERSFSYQFVSRNAYQTTDDHGNTTHESKILELEENRFTDLLIRGYFRDADEEVPIILVNPIPNVYERMTE